MDDAAKQSLHIAFCKNDVATIRAALAANPELKQLINAPIGPFESPPIVNVRSKEMLDLLLGYGADINAKSQWWAGGFCLLDSADDDLARYAVQRGATVGVHQAARLGWMDELKRLIAENPNRVTARGGDGKHPLHFARNVEVAKFLLDHGAEIDAKDIDHESTPAQYLIGEHPEVARFLVDRGAKTDIFMAAALCDRALVEHHLAKNPEAIRQRINAETFPMSNPRAGGMIYFWTLGRDFSPHRVAKKFRHPNIVTFLLNRSSPDVQLINYCFFGDFGPVKRLLHTAPNLIAQIRPEDHRVIADAALDRDWPAVCCLLEAGFPTTGRGQHGATALHWAAWHGASAVVELLLQRRPDLEVKDAGFNSAPLGWAMHGSENGWYKNEGDYAAVARLLIKAGAKLPDKISGTPDIKAVIQAAAT